MSDRLWKRMRFVWFCSFGIWGCSNQPTNSNLNHKAPKHISKPISHTETFNLLKSNRPKSEPSRPVNAFVNLEKPNVFGLNYQVILKKLREQEVALIEKGSGGKSVGFKIQFVDGTQAYFKPEQSFSGAHWFSEIAAFHLDKLLGFGRVAPTTGWKIPWKNLKKILKNHPRKGEVVVQKNGMVRGALIGWIPEQLVPLKLGVYWEKWIRLQGPIELTPFQSAAGWRKDLNKWVAWSKDSNPQKPKLQLLEGRKKERGVAGVPDREDRPQELSDLIVFDYLISNVDRWSENFTNVRTLGENGPLLFFDNGAGFWVKPRPSLQDKKIKLIQKFNRTTIEAIKKFKVQTLRDSLASDPLVPVLEDFHLDGLRARKAYFLEYVETLHQRFGDAIYFENTGILRD